MAQALEDVDVNDASAPNTDPGSNGNVPPPSNADEATAQSKLSKTAQSVKESTVKTSKEVAEKTKERLSMEGQLKQARVSLERFVNPKILKKQINEDTRIPKWILKRAKGLVFLSVLKAGFLFAGNVGTGCVIVRQPNGGWTGPSSIGVAGVSFGFLAGASKVDYIMILPDDRAVKQFTGKGQLRLGGEIQLAVGPIGRDGSGSVGAGDKGVSVVYSYSHCQGLYGGLALDGKVISVRPDCNRTFYKRSVNCNDILNGNIDEIPQNEDYDMVIHLLDSYCLDDDMTPIKGEKLSIDDLQNDENDEKKDGSKDEEVSVGRRLSIGWDKMTKSISQKWLQLTDKNDKEYKEVVKLQQSDKKPDDKSVIGSNKADVKSGSNVAHFEIGGDQELNAPDVSSDNDDDAVAR